jgi:SAM-dependent methyltransferase
MAPWAHSSVTQRRGDAARPRSTHQWGVTMSGQEDLTTQYQKLVEDEWVNEQATQSWARWHEKLTIQGAAMTERLASHARIREGMTILDLSCGTGDPAITLARMVGPAGHVTAADLSPGMVETTRTNARKAGITNLSAETADAQALPFADSSFDAVTCRLGIMYFVNLKQALQEISRVLRPGGRMAFAAWGPFDQGSYVSFVLGPLLARRPLPEPPPGMPWPGRFGVPGSMSDELHKVGLPEIEEENCILPFPWPGSAEEVCEQFYDVAIPMRPFIDSFSPEDRAQAFQEALATLPPTPDVHRTELTAAVNFASAGKPIP